MLSSQDWSYWLRCLDAHGNGAGPMSALHEYLRFDVLIQRYAKMEPDRSQQRKAACEMDSASLLITSPSEEFMHFCDEHIQVKGFL